MKVTLHLLLLVLAFVLFLVAGLGVSSRLNLVALGLAAWVLTLIV